MHQFAIAAMGRDQPGIVAEVGEALLALDVSIDDSSMTILGGHFAMLLLIHGTDELEAEHVRGALDDAVSRFDLQLEVRNVGGAQFSDQDRDDYVVSAYGPDRQGLVSTLSRVLADAHANITDFGSRIGADGTFAMWFNVTVLDTTDIVALGARLGEAGAALDLDVRLYRAEAEGL